MAEQFVNNEYQAYLQLLAESNVVDGVIYEPRGFFDLIPLDGTREVAGHPEVFRNGEAFPITITHMTASVAYLDKAGESVVDERLLQRIGLYLNFHDQAYMNPPQQLGGNGAGSILRAAPLPTWSNVITSAADALTRGTSSWRFPKPFILAARDTLNVRTRFYDAPDEPVPVSVSFTGIGMISRQPYFFSAVGQWADAAWHQLDPTGIAYANDGAEPVMIVDMVVNVQADITQADPTGDSRRVYVDVRQIGNGTQAKWFSGPIDVPTPGSAPQFVPDNAMPGILLGVRTGRALVHQFPVELVWQPGEGISVIAQALTETVGNNVSLNLALTGYITVT